MRRTFLIVSFLTGTFALIGDTNARERLFVQRTQACVPCGAPELNTQAPTAASAQREVAAERRVAERVVETLKLDPKGTVTVRVCIVCPPEADVIIEGRRTTSAGKIREYDLTLPVQPKLDAIQLVVLDGDEVLSIKPITVKDARAQTIVIADRVTEAMANLKVQEKELEARQRDFERSKLEDERSKLEEERAKLVAETAALKDQQKKLMDNIPQKSSKSPETSPQDK